MRVNIVDEQSEFGSVVFVVGLSDWFPCLLRVVQVCDMWNSIIPIRLISLLKDLM